MNLLRTAFRTLGVASLSFALLAASAVAETRLGANPWAKIERDLVAEGLSPKFVRTLRKNYRLDQREKVLKLNVLSFLGTPSHHELVTDKAVKNVRSFLRKNRKTLARAERRFGVPASVIASLLWIETRHGSVKGNFHVPSVFLTLYTAKDSGVQAYLEDAASRDGRRLASAEEISEKVKSRSLRKSKWALEQLYALQKMYRKNGGMVKELKGSFAGAWGIPQFIPSSYHTWAASSRRGKPADLNRMDDAIFSVANYLKTNDWGRTYDARMKSLMTYNNSSDYAEAILELSARASGATALAKASLLEEYEEDGFDKR